MKKEIEKSVDVERYVETSEELTGLASAPELRGGKELLAAVRRMLEKEQERLEGGGGLNDADWSKDKRAQWGGVQALKRVLGLPAAARRRIERV